MDWLEFWCMMKLRMMLGEEGTKRSSFYHPWKELEGWWIQAVCNYNFSNAYMHWVFQWNQTKSYVTWTSKKNHQHHGGRQWKKKQLLKICVAVKSWYSITFCRMFKMKMVIIKLRLHAKRAFPQRCWDM
jgi:hypothetical protein